ncbi:MAG: efflux RND transporter periplasmic adaptor subunit [Synergistaceae bacterium]|nr:efflux RND transporter periplasmic adaptor subunit [Synergistaceae bacterium]
MSLNFGKFKKLRIIFWLVILATGAALLGIEVNIKLKQAAANIKALEVTDETVFPVTAATLSAQTWETWKSYYGQAKAVRTHEITSYVKELIHEVPVQVGDRVEAGQTVVTLVKSDHILRAQAAKTAYDEALLNYNRLSELHRQGGIARAEVDRAYSMLKNSESTLQSSRSTLQRTELKSSVDGIVSSRNVEPGEIASDGKSLVTIVDLSEMEAQLMVSKKDIHNINRDTKVEIIIDNEVSSGNVKRISPEAQAGSGLFPVVVGLESSSSILPGSYLEGKFLVEKKDGVIVIPSDVIVYRNNKEYVYIAENGKAKMVEITTGEGRDAHVVVSGGLKAGDQLIISGNRTLFDGALISKDIKI